MENKRTIKEQFADIDGREGLPEELFIAVSTIIPIVNVDLFLLDSKNRILLSWRNDHYFGQGWHLPGGCIRYKETMMERLQKTALHEIGTNVIIKPEPIAVRDVILGRNDNQIRERAHHLAILYECKLPESFQIDNAGKNRDSVGYLHWFEQIPKDILAVHKVYQDIFERYGLILQRTGKEQI